MWWYGKWHKCYICGKGFGQHEPCGSLQISPFEAVHVCPICAPEAEKRNRKNKEEFRQRIIDYYGKELFEVVEVKAVFPKSRIR